MDMIKLRGGPQEAEAVVRVLLMTLRGLYAEHWTAFYDAVMLARDPAHKIFSESQRKALLDLSLIGRGDQMHESIRNIIRAAVEGDGLEMRIIDPREATQSPANAT